MALLSPPYIIVSVTDNVALRPALCIVYAQLSVFLTIQLDVQT